MKPKFAIGIGVILSAIMAVMVLTILGNSSLEVDVNQLTAQMTGAQKTSGPALADRSLKLTGVVVGDSVSYDPTSLKLEFDVVNSRDDLINRVSTAPRVRVIYSGAKPDTLVNEARAIATGRVDADGKFHVGTAPDALLVQCPTKYQAVDKVASQ